MWSGYYGIRILELIYKDSKILSEQFFNDDIGIFAKRQSGKTFLSALLAFHYGYNSKEKLNLCTLSKESMIKKFDEICYYNYSGNKWERSHNDFYDIKKFIYKKPFLNHIREAKYDVVMIDEFFYINFTDTELADMFGFLKNRGTKIIVNGTPQRYLEEWNKNLVNKIKVMGGLKIIDDVFLENLSNYGRGLKIKKLVEKI